MPTKSDILKLRRWARAALAWRCAKRVQPIIFEYWVDMPRSYAQIIDRAMALAENCIRDGKGVPGLAASLNEIEAVIASADSASFVAAQHADDSDAPPLRAVAKRAVSEAVRATDYAIRAASRAASDDSAFSAEAAEAAAQIAYLVEGALEFSSSGKHPSVTSAVSSAVWRDYDQLAELASKESWTDDTPIDLALLGPIGPVFLPLPKFRLASSTYPSRPVAVIVRDMNVLTDEEYRGLVAALADLAEASGAAGIQRLVENGFTSPVPEVVP